MSDSEELETLVYCLGQIGGEHNPVITSGSAFDSKEEYTRKGYSRYVEEANNIVKYMRCVLNYFLESVKSEFEEDPLAFIDSESEEDLLASIQKMKKQWRDMFKEHQKKLRESLKNQTLDESSSEPKQTDEESTETPKQSGEDSSEESSSSSAKMRKMDPEAVSEASAKASEFDSETTSYEYSEGTEMYSEGTEMYSEGTSKTSSVGVPVESLEFPESIFLRRLKEFGRVLKAEYLELRAKMGKALDRIAPDHTAHDLKGFTLQKMEKFAKWKYTLKALDHLVPELDTNLALLDLDFNKRKSNETRLTDWMYFDDGKRDRKYHHRLLIPFDLTVSIEEISAIIWRQIRRYKKIKQSLEKQLPEEYAAFKEKLEHWKYEVLYHRPMKTPVKVTKSTQSDDTYFNVEDMPEDT